MSKLQSEYLVFVDESGSHTMGNIDPQYPLFVTFPRKIVFQG